MTLSIRVVLAARYTGGCDKIPSSSTPVCYSDYGGGAVIFVDNSVAAEARRMGGVVGNVCEFDYPEELRRSRCLFHRRNEISQFLNSCWQS